MAVPAPWEKNNSDLFPCLFLNRKHVISTVPWTFQIIRTDETSCFEKFAFIHQVKFLLISNIMLFLWNPTFPLPLFSKIQLLSSQASMPQVSISQAVLCTVTTTCSVHGWAPAEWHFAPLWQSSAASGQPCPVRWGGCGLSLRWGWRAGWAGGPATPHDPWLSTALPSHPAAWCQTHLPACDSPCSSRPSQQSGKLLPGAVMQFTCSVMRLCASVC